MENNSDNLEQTNNSVEQIDNNDEVSNQEKTEFQEENDTHKPEVVEEKEDDSNETNSITNSMVEITKSQFLASEQESQECHTKADFITSTSNHLIESTYESKETETSEENNETNENKQNYDISNSCVDLGNTEEMSNEIIELNNSMITSVQLNAGEESTEEEVHNKEEMTESCVDLGAENETKEEKVENTENNEESNDYQPNNSMEIIDKKQCETNEEEYEKVEAVKEEPKRRIEDEVFEKPLGGDSLLKKITEYGEEFMGRDWRPSSGQMCIVSYEARLKDTDNIVEKNENFSFILGDGDVISAIDLVVSLMAKNEKCEMITEARHAYGTLGKKPDIPSNATLFYTIHLKDFQDLTELGLMEPVERLSLSEAKKLRGNFYFNRQEYPLAVSSYRKGLKYFDLENLKSDEEKEDLLKFAELKKALLMNLALSDFKQGNYKNSLNSLNEVLSIEPNHMKALYIRGKAYMQLGETQDAIKSLSKAHELAKDNVEVKNELMKAQQKHKTQYEKEKKMYQKMMRSPEEKKAEKKAQSKSTYSGIASYTIAGMIMAGATLGVAMLAKYKNLL